MECVEDGRCPCYASTVSILPARFNSPNLLRKRLNTNRSCCHGLDPNSDTRLSSRRRHPPFVWSSVQLLSPVPLGLSFHLCDRIRSLGPQILLEMICKKSLLTVHTPSQTPSRSPRFTNSLLLPSSLAA